MTSARERQQRAAARAKLARQMAERQAAAKKRRQWLGGLAAAVAVVVVAAGTFWVVSLVVGGDDDPDDPPIANPTPTADPAPTAPVEPGECVWNEVGPDDPSAATAVDVGLPAADEPREGTQVISIETNLGLIEVAVDLAAAPCIAASFSHLAGEEFYDGTKCHRMFPGMLQCGDPNVPADQEGYPETAGQGGPSYRFANENLPVSPDPNYYPAGVVALANSGPDTNGSQFFIIYQGTDLDGPNYSVVGEVITGLDVLDQVDAIGHDGAFDPSPGGGRPNDDIIIEQVRVSDPS